MEPLDDLLPNITIKPDNSPNDFISKMGKIVKVFSDIECKKDQESDKSVLNLSLTFKKAKKQGLENLYGMFFVRSKDNEKVYVELSSSTWAISPPAYNKYVQLTKQFLGPFINAYNKLYSTRCRFHIPKKEQLEIKLSPIILRVF